MKTDFNVKITSTDPESLSHVFQHQEFGMLLKKTQHMAEIRQILQKVLPPEIMQHVQVANIHAEQLVIIIDNANWGMMIRYQEAAILQMLHLYSQYQMLKKICYRIIPFTTPSQIPSPAPTSTNVTISSKSAKMIQGVAENIQDPLLKASLLRLARLDEVVI